MLNAAWAALIWMALVAAWVWDVVELFCEVDPASFPRAPGPGSVASKQTNATG